MNPEVVSIPHAAGRFHINPHDERARKKLIFDAVRNRYSINRRFWNDFIAAVQPDLALDIGTNYGECIFSPTYPDNTRAIAFEANPELVGYLEKTRHDHPSMNQIEVINALVGKEPSGQLGIVLIREQGTMGVIHKFNGRPLWLACGVWCSAGLAP